MDLSIRLQNDPHDVGVILHRAVQAEALGFTPCGSATI